MSKRDKRINSGERKRGIISMLNLEKAYGFIVCPDEGEDGEEYFFHMNDVREEGEELDSDMPIFETLNTGDKVEFLPLFNPKTKKWKGLGVTRIA